MADTNFIRIQKYLSGEMDAEEFKLFETDLLYNSELADDLKLQKEVNGFILNYNDKNDFRKVLDDVHQKYITEFIDQEDKQKQQKNIIPIIKSRNTPRVFYWSAAAVILAIFTFTVVLKLTETKKSNEILFAEFYQTHEPFNLRSSDTIQKGSLNDCMKEYSKRNYSEALLCFKNSLNEDKNNRIGIFFSGISCIETHDYQTAISSFNRLIELKDNNFKDPSIWYSGLSYLKLNKTDSALSCFNKLITEDNFYKKQAQKIIKELE